MTPGRLDFTDFLGLFSLYLNIRNLEENEQQSAQSVKLLQNIDVTAANDKQAAYLLGELGRKFDEQNELLKQILEAVKK